MLRIITFLLICFSGISLHARQDIRIGLFQEYLLKSFVFHCVEGGYKFDHPEGSFIVNPGELIYFNLIADRFYIGDGRNITDTLQTVNLIDISGRGLFRLKALEPVSESRNYEGELEISVQHGHLLVVNKIDMDKYLAGVVEAEGGPGAHLEYYKAQAILCRTYSIKNFHAHREEGFNLCDHTHCQAYKGKSERNGEIMQAVLATHNLLLTGKFIALIDAVYHANSGGQTQRASEIWPGGAEYLQSVVDPFSLDMPGSRWEKTMSLASWREFLFIHDIKAALNADAQNLLISQAQRRRFFTVMKDSIRIDLIRTELKLRSSFFDMELQNDKVIFKGKGYGHGVGLSQEGAMNMAKQGYGYYEILLFYFHQVQVRYINDIPDQNLPVEFQSAPLIQ
jgi:stage II sporulation protein D